MAHITTLVILALGMVVAVTSDIAARRIPNVLCIAMVMCGLIVNIGFSDNGLRGAAFGLFLGLILGLILWMLGVIKAGDAKLMIGISTLMGGTWFINCFLWSMLIGMVVGIAILIQKRELLRRLRRVKEYAKGLLLSRSFRPYEPKAGTERELPFAIPLTLGCVFAEWLPLV